MNDMRAQIMMLCSGMLACSEVRSPPSVEHFGDDTAATSDAPPEGQTSAASSDEGTSTNSTGAESESPAMVACAARCAAEALCGSDVDPYLCEVACAQALAEEIDLPGCVDGEIALMACVAALDCEGWGEFTTDPRSRHCASERADADAACDPTCTLTGSATDPEAMACSATFACGLTQRAVDCVRGTCMCLVDEAVVGSCDGDPACGTGDEPLDPSYWSELAESCCGFAPPA
jgi:hypothetical protein